MTVDDLSNFDKLKERILTTYELCSDVYRTRFRTFVKRPQETYTEFSQNMFVNFKRWLTSVNAFDDIERLKQEFMLERLYETISNEMKLWCKEKKFVYITDACKECDEYVTMHKNVSARTQNATNQQPSQQPSQQQRPLGGVNSGWQRPNNFRQGNARVYCSYCKMNNHSLDKCFRRPRDNQPVGLVKASSNQLSTNPYLFSVKVLSQAFCNDGVFIMGYRDTGASVTLLIEGSVPSRYVSITGETIKVISANGHADHVPLCKMHVMSEMVSGHITVALVPRTYTLPGYCQFLLGNNFGEELVPAKSVTDKTKTVTAAVTTRSMTRKRTHADTAVASSGESTCSKTQQTYM